MNMPSAFLTDIAPKAPINNGFVVIMGVGVVFIGLVCIIILIKLMSIVLAGKGTASMTPSPAPASAPAPAKAAPAPAVSGTIENRAEIVAAVCAAVAEELGTDVSALRVVSFKKLS